MGHRQRTPANAALLPDTDESNERPRGFEPRPVEIDVRAEAVPSVQEAEIRSTSG